MSFNMTHTLCPKCGGPLIQKNKVRLFLAGIASITIGTGLFLLNYKFWPLSFFLLIVAIYLLAWGWLAKGLWCRQCKSAPFTDLNKL